MDEREGEIEWIRKREGYEKRIRDRREERKIKIGRERWENERTE